MRFAIVGAGGIGGYLAARLIAAGEEVSLLARGGQLQAIRAAGLRLIDPEGDLTVRPHLATDDPAALGVPDVVVMAVKAHQLADAIAQVAPVVGPGTRVLPFQNGVDAPDMLAGAFGETHALIGVARFFANITAPGVITRYGAPRGFTIGTLDGGQAGVADIIARLRGAGIEAPDHPDVRVDLWTKFILFNAMSSITAGTRKRFGALRTHPETVALVRRLMDEVRAVGMSSGVPLGADLVEECMSLFLEVLPDEGRTSTAHDLEEGRALEIDHICGAVARRGTTLGVDVSASETVYALLRPWRDGA